MNQNAIKNEDIHECKLFRSFPLFLCYISVVWNEKIVEIMKEQKIELV